MALAPPLLSLSILFIRTLFITLHSIWPFSSLQQELSAYDHDSVFFSMKFGFELVYAYLPIYLTCFYKQHQTSERI